MTEREREREEKTENVKGGAVRDNASYWREDTFFLLKVPRQCLLVLLKVRWGKGKALGSEDS
jgi:hypothetical protein